jgi:hypothetical protein
MLRSRILSLMLHVDSYCKKFRFCVLFPNFPNLFFLFEGVFGLNCDMGTINFFPGGGFSMWVS